MTIINLLHNKILLAHTFKHCYGILQFDNECIYIFLIVIKVQTSTYWSSSTSGKVMDTFLSGECLSCMSYLSFWHEKFSSLQGTGHIASMTRFYSTGCIDRFLVPLRGRRCCSCPFGSSIHRLRQVLPPLQWVEYLIEGEGVWEKKGVEKRTWVTEKVWQTRVVLRIVFDEWIIYLLQTEKAKGHMWTHATPLYQSSLLPPPPGAYHSTNLCDHIKTLSQWDHTFYDLQQQDTIHEREVRRRYVWEYLEGVWKGVYEHQEPKRVCERVYMSIMRCVKGCMWVSRGCVKGCIWASRGCVKECMWASKVCERVYVSIKGEWKGVCEYQEGVWVSRGCVKGCMWVSRGCVVYGVLCTWCS